MNTQDFSVSTYVHKKVWSESTPLHRMKVSHAESKYGPLAQQTLDKKRPDIKGDAVG